MLKEKIFSNAMYKPEYERFSKALLRKSGLESTDFNHESNRLTKIENLPQVKSSPTGPLLPSDPVVPDFQPARDFAGSTRDQIWERIRRLLRGDVNNQRIAQGYRDMLERFRGRGVLTRELFAKPLSPNTQVDANGMTATGQHTFTHNGTLWRTSSLGTQMHGYRHLLHDIDNNPGSFGLPASTGYFPKVATTVIPESLRTILGKLRFPESTYANTVSDNITMHHADAERASQSIANTPRRPAFFFMPDAHEDMFRHLNQTSDATESRGEPFIPREKLGYLIGSHHIDTESGTPFTIIHHYIRSTGASSTGHAEELTDADEHRMWALLKHNPHFFDVGTAHSHPPGNFPLQSGSDLLNAIVTGSYRQPYNMSIVHGPNSIRDRQGNILSGAEAHEYLRDHAQAELGPNDPDASYYGGRNIIPYTDMLRTTSSDTPARPLKVGQQIYPTFDPDTGRASIPNTGTMARLYGNRSITQFLSGYHGTHREFYPIGSLSEHRYPYGTLPATVAQYFPVIPVRLPDDEDGPGLAAMVSLPAPLPACYSITKMGRFSHPYGVTLVHRNGGPAIEPNLMGSPHNANTIGAPRDEQGPVADVLTPVVGAMNAPVRGVKGPGGGSRLQPPGRIEMDAMPRIVRSMRSHPFPFASYPLESGLNKGDQG